MAFPAQAPDADPSAGQIGPGELGAFISTPRGEIGPTGRSMAAASASDGRQAIRRPRPRVLAAGRADSDPDQPGRPGAPREAPRPGTRDPPTHSNGLAPAPSSDRNLAASPDPRAARRSPRRPPQRLGRQERREDQVDEAHLSHCRTNGRAVGPVRYKKPVAAPERVVVPLKRRESCRPTARSGP